MFFSWRLVVDWGDAKDIFCVCVSVSTSLSFVSIWLTSCCHVIVVRSSLYFNDVPPYGPVRMDLESLFSHIPPLCMLGFTRPLLTLESFCSAEICVVVFLQREIVLPMYVCVKQYVLMVLTTCWSHFRRRMLPTHNLYSSGQIRNYILRKLSLIHI